MPPIKCYSRRKRKSELVGRPENLSQVDEKETIDIKEHSGRRIETHETKLQNSNICGEQDEIPLQTAPKTNAEKYNKAMELCKQISSLLSQCNDVQFKLRYDALFDISVAWSEGWEIRIHKEELMDNLDLDGQEESHSDIDNGIKKEPIDSPINEQFTSLDEVKDEHFEVYDHPVKDESFIEACVSKTINKDMADVRSYLPTVVSSNGTSDGIKIDNTEVQIKQEPLCNTEIKMEPQEEIQSSESLTLKETIPYNNKILLEDTEKIVDTSANLKFICKLCQKTFSQERYLTTHLRNHRRSTNWKCFECNRSFLNKRLLTKHSLEHFSRTFYSCDICKKLLFDKKEVLLHSKVHSDQNTADNLLLGQQQPSQSVVNTETKSDFDHMKRVNGRFTIF